MHLPVLDAPTLRHRATQASPVQGPRSIAAVRVLRLSITDRCNFRCIYCMPEEGVRWIPGDHLLALEEISEIVRAAVEVHGIGRFKITGGEPTVRAEFVELARMLRRVGGVKELSLTTNGMLLEKLAGPLFDAGLDRVTVSIDSLRPERFRRITRTGDLSVVLRGLDRCEEVGFSGTKINCVTMRGVNDDEVVEFARLTLRRAMTVRFIEYMPLGDAAVMHADDGVFRVADSETGPAGGCGAQNRGDVFVAESEVRRQIEKALGTLEAVDRTREPGVGPAIVYRLARGNPAGRIGFISAMSAPFCATCNRLRLTADGVLRSCLFDGGEIDLRPILRRENNPLRRRAALARAMVDCVALKPDVHSLHGDRQMSQIGG